MEIVLEAVVVQALGPSSGPEILIFKRFRSAWPSIDQRKFSIVSSDPDALRYVQNIADSTISFAKKQLNDYQPRDDYKELLTLTIIFLGGVPNKGISFRAPAGLHRARWMAKAIYCLKLFMFRDQFKMTKRELKAITEIDILELETAVERPFFSRCEGKGVEAGAGASAAGSCRRVILAASLSMTLIDSPAVARQRLPARRANHWARSPDKHDGKTFANFLLRRALLIAPTHEGFMRMPYDLYCPSLQKDRKLLVERICQQCGQYFCTKKRAKECHGHHTAHETPTRILTLRGREVLCVVREDDDAEWLDETEVNMSQTSLPITTASEEEALPVVTLNESLATPWDEDNIN
ncbi:hypothetical protein EVAR_55365_1 [Eumeta japonica]|uniref:Uncharacterized protein n=1 Tax=Eumeta variegata TaxID=151549 RepID=A0A4C1YY18_EUMVA|nr:hypothetical protein EVAR_55365_1 [Eumeta japonica]